MESRSEVKAIIIEDSSSIIFELQEKVYKTINGLVKVLPTTRSLMIILDELINNGHYNCVELILLDYSVQGRPSISIIKDIQNHLSLSSHVKIIGHSGHINAEDEFRKAGANAFISKSVNPLLFEDILLQCIQSNSWIAFTD